MTVPWAAVEFRAMGTSCRVVAPDRDAAEHAVGLVDQLERAWSRFRPDSEISELNRSDGRVCIVSPVTFELVSRAERARRVTCGVFNPLLLDQLEALGYDRTWEAMHDADDPAEFTLPGSERPIELFADASAVRLPEGTRFDPGGIGKGLAGDLVAAALRSAGADSVQVELGGDVRVDGPAWSGERWGVCVDDTDHDSANAATVWLTTGGVATSSVVRRRWRRGAVELHHLLDPTTGTSVSTDLDAVTAVAGELWWAEVVAKVALAAGSRGARSTMERFGTTGLLVAPGPSYEPVTLCEVAA